MPFPGLRFWLLLATLMVFPIVARTQSPLHKPQGAKDQPHWAFLPVKKSTVPAVSDKHWVRNPIDAFVLNQFEARKLTPAPVADKRALLRRVYFDLIGLPPTPEEQRAFLED